MDERQVNVEVNVDDGRQTEPRLTIDEIERLEDLAKELNRLNANIVRISDEMAELRDEKKTVQSRLAEIAQEMSSIILGEGREAQMSLFEEEDDAATGDDDDGAEEIIACSKCGIVIDGEEEFYEAAPDDILCPRCFEETPEEDPWDDIIPDGE